VAIDGFDRVSSKSSIDLDNMIFLVGSIFIFGSWIYEADGDGKLQRCLLKDSEAQRTLTISSTVTNQLVEKFS
jgi:hypothetical protein